MNPFDQAIETAAALQRKRAMAVQARQPSTEDLARLRAIELERLAREATAKEQARLGRIATYHTFPGTATSAIFDEREQLLCEEFIDSMSRRRFPGAEKLMNVERKDVISGIGLKFLTSLAPSLGKKTKEVHRTDNVAAGYGIGFFQLRGLQLYLCTDGGLRVYTRHLKPNPLDPDLEGWWRSEQVHPLPDQAKRDEVRIGYTYQGDGEWVNEGTSEVGDFSVGTSREVYKSSECFQTQTLEEALTRLAITSANAK